MTPEDLLIEDADPRATYPHKPIALRHWLGFTALCMLWSSAWLVDGAWPPALPLDVRRCLHYLIVASAFSYPALRSISRHTLRQRPWARLALASVCLIALPAVLVDKTSGAVSATMVSALFGLVPVVVIIVAPHVRGGSPSTSLLPAALLGLTGNLLLLQFALPESWPQARLDGVVMVAVVVAAVASIWMYRLIASFTVLQAASVFCLANALCFALSAALAGVSNLQATSITGLPTRAIATEVVMALVFDLPQIVLLLWLLREVQPTRLAARYLAVPLLTVVEGSILLRPEFSARVVIGALLLAAGCYRLLTAREFDDESGLVLR